MKKFRARVLSITVISVIMAGILGGCNKSPEFVMPEDPDVRHATWNMTMEEVILSEGGKEPDEVVENTSLTYKNVRMEKIPEANITYNFYNVDLVNTDGKERLLSSVVYSFTGLRSFNQRQLHNLYIDVVEEYSKKYGPPIRDERVTELSNNGTVERVILYEPVEKIYDTTFAFGGTALYVAEWENEWGTTDIKLRFLFDEQRGPFMDVFYEYLEPNNDI